MRGVYANFKMNKFFGRDVINQKNNVEKKSRMKQVKIDGVLPSTSAAENLNPLENRIFAFQEERKAHPDDSDAK